MKLVLSLAVAAGALWAASAAPAMAESDPYKWCAIYSGSAIDGSKGCWFVTREQCEATVNGLAGFCQPNYRSGDSPVVRSKRMKNERS